VPFASVLAGAAALQGWRHLDRLGGWQPGAIAVALVAGVALSALLGARFVVQSVTLDERVQQVADSAARRLAPGDTVLVIDRHPQTVLFAMGHRGWHRTELVADEVRQFEWYGADVLLVTETSPSWSDGELMGWAEDRWPTLAGTSQWTLFQLGADPE
jgi:hypothetical protein